jgi:AcrR family transcriptional regulator
VASPVQRRLSHEARREQLLETALAIVREEGADALTLIRLAERAGVSKPIAYDHFGTRAGLLIALYTRIDDQQADALRQAIAAAPQTLDDVADLFARSYVHCYMTMGPEALALSAALKGSPEMEAAQQALIDGYVDLAREALSPFAAAAADFETRCVGLIGAAEAISHDMLKGRISEADAAATLAALIKGGLSA